LNCAEPFAAGKAFADLSAILVPPAARAAGTATVRARSMIMRERFMVYLQRL
jgi:hypothetical protein